MTRLREPVGVTKVGGKYEKDNLEDWTVFLKWFIHVSCPGLPFVVSSNIYLGLIEETNYRRSKDTSYVYMQKPIK